MNEHHKYPRLFIKAPFEKNAAIDLTHAQNHYLKTVLRKKTGDGLRVFNGEGGEWIARIEILGKKAGTACLKTQIKVQPSASQALALYFSPIKKHRMDFLIEKAVELGVTELYPVMMNRTTGRHFNEDRINAQIIEASEQCERLTVPVLHPVSKLEKVLANGASLPLYVCTERDEASVDILACNFSKGAAFMVGPEGGFDDDERDYITQAVAQSVDVKAVSLGETILRAETAALACLAYARFKSV